MITAPTAARKDHEYLGDTNTAVQTAKEALAQEKTTTIQKAKSDVLAAYNNANSIINLI